MRILTYIYLISMSYIAVLTIDPKSIRANQSVHGGDHVLSDGLQYCGTARLLHAFFGHGHKTQEERWDVHPGLQPGLVDKCYTTVCIVVVFGRLCPYSWRDIWGRRQIQDTMSVIYRNKIYHIYLT